MLKLEPQEVLKNPLSLPDDIEPLTKDKPGYTWLSKYLDKIPAWILWSEYKQWLIFPYIINGNLEAWQARNFSGFGPKWLTFGNVKTLYYFCGSKHAKCVVLVEDIVSAIKIGQAGGCAMPLFGTQIGLERFIRLSGLFSGAKVWLDPDMRQKAAKEAYSALSVGFPVITVMSNADPKEHTYDFIKDTISTANRSDKSMEPCRDNSTSQDSGLEH